ncbi:hypothetical protein Clacol_002369 [Clathrus columnatus]|uniref:Checkpoint protein n=1 Tax=Clathrus columnatus TaxID=1419009 RepID=A0AAV5A0H8_9AGAM|nr:hypothetical protein Clacol_002369 [Clathrus columnatus]
MRFRALLQDATTLYRIIQTVERLSKTCILRLSPTHLRIICDKANEGGIQVWSLVKRETLFEDYRIESNANDEITLKLSTDALAQALKSASLSSSPETIVKLAKKNNHAVLSFGIIIKTRQNKELAVTQDVGIEVLRPQDVEKMKEPMCPEPDVHIFLPPLPKLRTVTEHLRQLSDVMGISANGNGHFKLFIETDTAKVDTEWSKCENPKIEIGETSEAGDVLTFYIPAMGDGTDG